LDELDVAFAAIVVAGVWASRDVLQGGARITAMRGRPEPGDEALE
jgi:hypothetical protein